MFHLISKPFVVRVLYAPQVSVRVAAESLSMNLKTAYHSSRGMMSKSSLPQSTLNPSGIRRA